MRRALGLLSLALSLGAGPVSAEGASAAADGLWFVDVAAEAGLVHPTWCGSTEKPHILESNGAGLALFDFDGDGFLDLYLTNGWRNEGTKILERGRNRLYRNRGDGTFDDVTDRSATGDDGWATGVGVGDPNGDGRPDLYVANLEADVLFLNQGDGSFRRMEDAPGIDGWSAGVIFFDTDGDGDEDLFVWGYVACSLEEVLNAEPDLEWEGLDVMLGPFGLEGEANRYFENLGDGRFAEADAGLEDKGKFYSFGVMALDLDADLDLDLYVANDSNPNYLYRNDGVDGFKEVGLWSGAALDQMGAAQAGMGLTAGDLDDDGLPDLFVTNFYRDASTFYRNLGDLIFEDATVSLGLKAPTFLALSWGTVLADFDLDGWLDLFVANGHIYPQADRSETAQTSFRQPNLLLQGGEGGFVDVSKSAGPGFEVVESSRGMAYGDLDNDGDLDLVIANMDVPPTLLRNDSRRRGSWLMVDAPDAVRVEVEVGERRFVRHRIVGGSYLSASDPRFHFGLGPASTVNVLTVFWPDGSTTRRTDQAVDRIVRIERSSAARSAAESEATTHSRDSQ